VTRALTEDQPSLSAKRKGQSEFRKILTRSAEIAHNQGVRSLAQQTLEKIKNRDLRIIEPKHDLEMAKFYSNFISPGTLCFDVGANVGNRGKIFLGLGARVVAIEPQGQCVNVLRRLYGKNKNLTLVEGALGANEGQGEIKIGDEIILSSMSPEWINAVRRSGRFSRCRWDTTTIIEITTLDKMIDQYGVPSFVKINVEGFEYEVVKGLSRPVKALSLEFTPEFNAST
jgi:FkbM family methyltransferase